MSPPPDSRPALSARPTGTVTLLFTDIEGSTRRWEEKRAAMPEGLRRHDDLLRTAIEARGGHVFKTVGDAFCGVFSRAPDAVAAAVDAQRAIAAEDWSAVGGLTVRMALHSGTTDERDADYFGPTVNRVARLLSLAHGGQVIVSGSTAPLLRGAMPELTELLDLGRHRLKDLTEPEQVWQLTIFGLRTEFPALKSLDTIPNNLPIQRTSFRGRERDVGEVNSLLGQHKLLTLFGSGGIGKTRLALQVGTEVLRDYPDGVWFIDFAPITDTELVSSVIAKEIGMPQVEGRRLDESIPQWLRRKKLLLILDNCEHVLEPVAAIADVIIGTCPDVRMLATSRQALDISGERIFRLASLDVPYKIADLTPAAIIEFGAVALFVDRAVFVDRSFALTDDTAPIVADICRRLDGIPLAIELAAARAKVLSIPNLAQRLNERFKILTGGSRSALPRQKTLGALIDWSYDLLTPQEQMLFYQVGIFAGGFSLDAASAVCGGEDLDEINVLELLSSLIDKSLVLADTTGEQERYHLLESTRAYALEKLTAAGSREQLARRHAECFRDYAQGADPRRSGGSTALWVASMELELDNYRAVLEWALKDGHDVALGAAVVGTLPWNSGGLVMEGRYWIGLAQASLDELAHPQVAARLWYMLSDFSFGKLRHDYAQRALVLFEPAGDEMWQARALYNLASGLFQMGNFEEASDVIARALPVMCTLVNKTGVAECLSLQGSIQLARGDVAAAREMFVQSLAAFKALGGPESGAAIALANLAEVEFADGHLEQAVRLAGEALEIDACGKNPSHLALDYSNLAAYSIALGDVDRAREAAREGLRLARQAQYPWHVALALHHIALLLALRGEVNDAAQLMGYVNAQFKDHGVEREATEEWGYEKFLAVVRERLSEAHTEKLAAEGAAWSEDQAVEVALKV
jgi:predicted ATPase/class 3 adenylate cyclase